MEPLSEPRIGFTTGLLVFVSEFFLFLAGDQENYYLWGRLGLLVSGLLLSKPGGGACESPGQ